MTKLNDNDQLIADRIYSIRKHLNFTQQEMADLLNTTYQYVSSLENGKRKPGYKTLQKLLTICVNHGLAVNAEYLRPDCN